MDENSGFKVPSLNQVPEKRPHEDRNVGPSGSSGMRPYMDEPEMKRSRNIEPPAPPPLVFNRDDDRDFRDERSMNRNSNSMSMSSTMVGGNSIRDDDRNRDFRQLDDRADRFPSDNRGLGRDLMDQQSSNRRQLMDQRNDDFESQLRRREQEFPNNRLDDLRMDELRRSDNFGRSQLSPGLDRMRGMNEPSSLNQRDTEFGRMSDLRDEMNDRMSRSYFDEQQQRQRSNRDDLLDERDQDIDRSIRMLNSMSDRGARGLMDLMDNRNGFPSQAANFQANLNDRDFDGRRSATQESRRPSPDRMFDRRNYGSDNRFSNSSRHDDQFDSARNFDNRRDDFRDRDRFDMGDSRRNDRSDFDDDRRRFSEVVQKSLLSDFDARDTQDRRNFNSFGNDMGSRRQNDFDSDRGMNFNFNRGNDFDDGRFSDRNRDDFDRRDMGGRFSRFN